MKVLLLLAALANSAVFVAAAKPNILLVLADDFGHANIEYNLDADNPSLKQTHTPVLNGLAKEGVILQRHYTYRICGPSRASLQSGRLAVHVNVYNTGVTVENEKDPVSGFTGIPRNMTVFAKRLREGGYDTHFVGKWDVGMATPEHTPVGRGYKSWVGYYTHANDYWNKGMGKTDDHEAFAIVGELDNCLNKFTDLSRQVEGGFNGGVMNEKVLDHKYYEEDIFKDEAIKIIKEHQPAKPLFLFYSSHLIHTPLQIPKSYSDDVDALTKEKKGEPYDIISRKLYAAMVYYLDTAVGKFVDELKLKFTDKEKTQTMYDNTLIVFIADNGGPVYIPGAANNHPLRGGKYSDWEGGIRGNAFVSGGFVPEEARGSTFNGVVSIADWYTTFCHVAHVDFFDYEAASANEWLRDNDLPQLHPVDGRNQWDAIISGTAGYPSTQNVRPDYFHISPESIMLYPFKLVTGEHPYSFWQGQLFPNCTADVSGPDKFEATWPGAGEHGPTFSDFKFMDEDIFIGGKLENYNKQVFMYDCGPAGCLFNVETDPGEHNELVGEEHAEIKRELVHALAIANMSIFAPNRGHPTGKACNAAIDHGGFYGPFSHVPEGYFTDRGPVTPQQQLANEKLKLQLKPYDDAETREELLVYAKKYGASDAAVASMHTIDACLAPNGDIIDNYVCLPGQSEEEGTCIAARFNISNAYS